MKRNQTPNEVCAKVIAKLDKILAAEQPDLILVQGDTTTTLAGALAGFYRKIPVGHVEAGLRSGNLMSPFPEEMNRRVVSQMASFHFASTEENRSNLLSEHVPSDKIFVTGNPVVDAMKSMLKKIQPSEKTKALIKSTENMKRLLVTTHRPRELWHRHDRKSQGIAFICRETRRCLPNLPCSSESECERCRERSSWQM
jgi:UDP-N-acetylglucosamine 2-epimerase (non-hydrolysing)